MVAQYGVIYTYHSKFKVVEHKQSCNHRNKSIHPREVFLYLKNILK